MSTSDGTGKYADKSLTAAIEYGQQLQKQKPNYQNNANQGKPLGLAQQRQGNIRKRPSKCNYRTLAHAPHSTFRLGPSSVRSRSASPLPSPAKSLSKIKRRKCPLRIAELAVPSKRHCIESWREGKDFLPTYMLERLKHIVTNQKVIATIPDAENCFKYHQKTDTSLGRKNHGRSSKHIIQDTDPALKYHIMIMCAIFAKGIKAKLSKKMNLVIPDDSKELSNVVAKEIHKLLHNNRNVYPDYIDDPELMQEMTAKITLWILNILVDAEYKQTSDELNVKKRQENIMGKEGNLVTLIDKYVSWQMEGMGKDLEEEEGPALDAIDCILDKVLNITHEKDLVLDIIDFGRPIYKDLTDATSQNVGPEDSFQEALPETESNIDDDAEFLDSENGAFSLETSIISTVNDNTENEDKNSQRQDISNESGKNDEEKLNVSDENVKLEDLFEKKVQFSKERVANGDTTGDIPRADANDAKRARAGTWPRIKFDEGNMKNSNPSLLMYPNYKLSATRIRSDIVFQPPNTSILNVADESWPDDCDAPLHSASLSRVKSIVSLGNIKEIDEYEQLDSYDHGKVADAEKFKKKKISRKESSSSNSINAEKTGRNFEQLYGNYMEAKTVADNILDSLVQDYETGIKDDNKNQPRPSNFSKTSTEGNSLRIVPPSKLLEDLKALLQGEDELYEEQKITNDNYTIDNNCKDVGKGDYNQAQEPIRTNKMPIAKAKKEKLRQASDEKFDYRVRPQTAPSWAMIMTNSASEDSEPVINKVKRLSRWELRKWCKDMEHTLINLEQWINWIDCSCRQILFMNKNTVAQNMLTPLDRARIISGWKTLKKTIDKDAILWRKLNLETVQILKTYTAPTSELRNKSPPPKHKRNDNVMKESVSEAMSVIESMSTRLHRSIVSTEHIIKDSCCRRAFSPKSKRVW